MSRAKIVLLVVDVQELITNERLYMYRRFMDNMKMLISQARKNGVEVIYVRHDDGEGTPLTKGTAGYDICGEISPDNGERIFDKCVNSSFRESGLLEYLRSMETERIIVTGLQTEYCIDAAVKCGFEHGFEVIVPAFCNTTVDNEHMTAEQTYRYYNEFIWKNRYARCMTAEEAAGLME